MRSPRCDCIVVSICRDVSISCHVLAPARRVPRRCRARGQSACSTSPLRQAHNFCFSLGLCIVSNMFGTSMAIWRYSALPGANGPDSLGHTQTPIRARRTGGARTRLQSIPSRHASVSAMGTHAHFHLVLDELPTLAKPPPSARFGRLACSATSQGRGPSHRAFRKR